MNTIIKILITLALLSIIFLSSKTNAQAPLVDLPATNKGWLQYFANKYNVNYKQMEVTMNCESSFNENAIGDSGHSFGLSQIYLPAHPEVTKEQALNPIFATEFMAREFSLGNQRIWTCYRNVYLLKM